MYFIDHKPSSMLLKSLFKSMPIQNQMQTWEIEADLEEGKAEQSQL